MAISNFKLPTGLEVSGTSTITGSVGVSQTLTAVNLTASGDISGSVGNYGSLFVNGSAVLTSVGLASYALSADVSSSFVQPSQVSASYVTPAQVSASFAQPADVSASFAKSADVSASFVQPSQVSASYTTPSQITGAVAFLTASNVFTVSQQITGGLSMTGDLSAQSASLTGDLTVNGNLTVKGVTTAIDSTTVNIGDANINLATGSATLPALNGAGVDLGSAAQVQWRYDNSTSAWKSNVALNVSSALPIIRLSDFPVVSRIANDVHFANNSLNGLTTYSRFSARAGGSIEVSGSTTASVDATNEVRIGTAGAPSVYVGSVSTLATAMNGATTTVVGVNSLFLSGANVYVTGATYHDSNVSGTTAQFTTITGSTVTGSTALFTTISGSQLTASTSLTAPTLVTNVLVASATNALNIAGGGTGSVDVFASANYSAAKYVIKANDNTTSEVHVLEALVATDGAAAFLTPYASTYTGASALITLSSSYGGGNVTVSALNNSANQVTVKFLKSYIA